MKKIIFIVIAATFVFCSCGKEKNEEYVEFYELGIMAQLKDLGYSDWKTADELCRSSRVGGFSNWRLPTIGELATLNQNKKVLKSITTGGDGWNRGGYWSSSLCNEEYNWYSIYCFSSSENGTGVTGCPPIGQDKRYVRAVRNVE